MKHSEDFPLDTVWLKSEEYEKKLEYLVGAYERLENNFIDYLTYVPFREENKHVSSSRLADYILRITPLLSISFRLLTFGTAMKAQYYYLKNNEGESRVRTLTSRLLDLFSKIHNHSDQLNDYYLLHSEEKCLWFLDTIRDAKCGLIQIVGEIDYPDDLFPFKTATWFSWKEIRNEIEHRGRTEASLLNVVHGLALLIIILEKLNTGHGMLFEFESEIFDKGWQRSISYE